MKLDKEIEEFLSVCHQHQVRIILVGGGAVNFHGYQRHSADLDFWIDTQSSNLVRLKEALDAMGYEFDEFPDSVKNGEQNISIKFSPQSPVSVELITAFSLRKNFQEAWMNSEEERLFSYPVVRYRILAFDDLIESKMKSGRPKDLLDIQELQRRRDR